MAVGLSPGWEKVLKLLLEVTGLFLRGRAVA